MTMTSVAIARREVTQSIEVFFPTHRVAAILTGMETAADLSLTPLVDAGPDRYRQSKVKKEVKAGDLANSFVEETTTYRQSDVFQLTPAALAILTRRVADHVNSRTQDNNRTK